MSEKYWKVIEKHQVKIIVGLLVVLLALLGAAIYLKVSAPYALASDGRKIEQPWAVMLGEKELFTVENEYTGEKIIKGIENYYVPDKANLEDVSVTPELTVTKKDLKRGDEHPEAAEVEEAVAEVVSQNQTADPILTVTSTENVTKSKPVKYKIVYKKTAKLSKGDEKIKRKGQNGKKLITSQVVRQNGEIVQTKVIETKIAKKPVDRVVKQGTNTTDTKSSTMTASANSSSTDSNGQSSSKSGSTTSQVSRGGSDSDDRDLGSQVISYASQFLGNPYVYGGTSLTKGADCSGFIMSVYEHFGYSLPHSSSAMRSSGKGVSYSEAKAGDIICYSGHVALYMGNGKIIHASSPSTGIITGNATYKSILAVRRIIN